MACGEPGKEKHNILQTDTYKQLEIHNTYIHTYIHTYMIVDTHTS